VLAVSATRTVRTKVIAGNLIEESLSLVCSGRVRRSDEPKSTEHRIGNSLFANRYDNLSTVARRRFAFAGCIARSSPSLKGGVQRLIEPYVVETREIEKQPAETPDCALGRPSVPIPVNVLAQPLDSPPSAVEPDAAIPHGSSKRCKFASLWFFSAHMARCV
jgi:hypothetical protein